MLASYKYFIASTTFCMLYPSVYMQICNELPDILLFGKLYYKEISYISLHFYNTSASEGIDLADAIK